MSRVLWAMALLFGVLAGSPARAGDVYGTRFSPPRLYFLHANINKGGIVSGLKGQDNFLSLYLPAIDNAKGTYSADAFSISVLLPQTLEMLDQEEDGLAITETELAGRKYQKVTKRLDATRVKQRCFDATWGVEEVLWYRVKAGAAVPPEPQEIRVTLRHRDQECFTDTARLRIYDALSAVPRVSPKHFRLYLHYGPHTRKGHWDELADYLTRAGINGIQCTLGGPEGLEYVREMHRRGFSMIAQRGASYESIYKDNMRACLEQGPKWFEKADQDTMRTYLPYADAALWDFEPSPLPAGLDDWLLARFREERKIPPEENLTPETIRAGRLREWIEFRQTQLATCIKHWADFCRSVKPDVETILTEGSVLAFDSTGQVDYARYQDHVTFCDPMNFTGIDSLHVVRQWMQRAPRARFTGCQNVALSHYHNVFISAPTIMMQTLSAALIGMHGTSVYPGPAMDAENFVAFHRVMAFLARHEKNMFAAQRDPANLLLAPVPKEEQEVTLGDGRKLRNTYPDWNHDALHRSYRSADGGQYLTVLANWNPKETCYFRLTASLPAGPWMVMDDEHARLFTAAGKPQVDAKALARGIFLQCPAFDFLGVRLARATPAALRQAKAYRRESLDAIAKAAAAYTQTGAGTAAAAGQGDQKLGFDDFDRDGKFEYLVQTGEQKVWVSQNGTVLRWSLGGEVVETEGLGLARDMVWLPQGERENRAMDTVMRLEGKQVRADGVALTFSRDAALASLGGGAGLRVVKELLVANKPGEVAVRVRLANTSVAADATSLDVSYRVHNYLKYGVPGATFWNFDGAAVSRWEDVEAHYTVPAAGLSEKESGHLFAQCEVVAPRRLASFGEYRPDRRLLLKVVPAHPERLLQILRWGRKAGMPGSGTIEWMYRPETLAAGKEAVYEYRLNLQPAADLDAQSAQPAAAAPAVDEHLVFHLNFDGGADAAFAKGSGKAQVAGTPAYEEWPGGRGVRISPGASLSYLPEGNANLERGRLYIRFKPAWEGADGKTHFLLTIRPKAGIVYLGKLDDGRLVFNMYDEKGGQHYPAHLIRTLQANTWHDATVTWDTTKGTMALYYDGQKVSEHRGDPWQMAPLDNRLAHSRITLPEGAEAVIDEVKVWDR